MPKAQHIPQHRVTHPLIDVQIVRVDALASTLAGFLIYCVMEDAAFIPTKIGRRIRDIVLSFLNYRDVIFFR